MKRSTVDHVAPPLYGVIDFLVVLAPAVAIKLAEDQGGMGDTDGVDLLVASAIIGLGHAIVASLRLRSEEHLAVRRADLWIAAIDALVVLAVFATLLPIVVLWAFPDEHASMANWGYPVVVLWAALQLIAVALSELTGRFVFRWLEPPELAEVP